MDSDYRNSELNKINKIAREICDLKSIKRTYSFYDLAIMTRAAPAKILGLKDRGSLKEGSIADIAIYNPKKPIDEMFKNAELVFKNGIEIVRSGRVKRHLKTKTKYLELNYDKKIHSKIKDWLDNYYSLNLKEFEVEEKYFRENNFQSIN